ncbi:hypothetical protein C8F01DRAFT_1362369 [Mycena amicta]|nr:hypothetical protein C8F01DRAFT_1362369 [Mycena amicta]
MQWMDGRGTFSRLASLDTPILSFQLPNPNPRVQSTDCQWTALASLHLRSVSLPRQNCFRHTDEVRRCQYHRRHTGTNPKDDRGPKLTRTHPRLFACKNTGEHTTTVTPPDDQIPPHCLPPPANQLERYWRSSAATSSSSSHPHPRTTTACSVESMRKPGWYPYTENWSTSRRPNVTLAHASRAFRVPFPVIFDISQHPLTSYELSSDAEAV